MLLNETEINPHSKLFYACMKDIKLLFIVELEGLLGFILCGQNVTSAGGTTLLGHDFHHLQINTCQLLNLILKQYHHFFTFLCFFLKFQCVRGLLLNFLTSSFILWFRWTRKKRVK